MSIALDVEVADVEVDRQRGRGDLVQQPEHLLRPVQRGADVGLHADDHPGSLRMVGELPDPLDQFAA